MAHLLAEQENDEGLDQGAGEGGQMLTAEHTGFADGLDVGSEEKEKTRG